MTHGTSFSIRPRARRARCALVAVVVLFAATLGACDKLPATVRDSDAPQSGDAPGPDLADSGDVLIDQDLPPGDPCLALLAADADSESVVIGGWTVTIGKGTGAWRVAGAGSEAPVLSGPGSCASSVRGPESGISVAAEGEPDVDGFYGAFRIRLDRGVAWQQIPDVAPEIEPISDSAQGIGVRWGSVATLEFRAQGEQDLRIALHAADARGGSITFDCRADEAFFGLGTQAVGLDLRGRRYPLLTQEQGITKVEGALLFPISNEPEAAYAPMGIWHSTAGYTALLTTDAVAELDLCDRDPARVRLRTWGETPGVVLVAGASIRERLGAATARYLGRAQPVAPWVFGPWNDAVGGPARLHEVATLLRQRDVPSSAIWSEDWIGGAQRPDFGFILSYAWEWDPARYPNLPADIAWLHGQGFAFLAYFNPFVPQPTRMWDEGEAGGFLIRDAQGSTYTFQDPGLRTASLVDLTNPLASSWLTGYLTAAAELGVDGWMADFAEWLPLDAAVASGEDAWLAHNRYPLAWQRVNRAALASAHANGSESADNWTFFVRSGWASTAGGTGGIAPAMWAGDQNTDWGYDDGMPSVIPIGTHVGLSGVAVFGSDIAGYTAALTPPTTKELFLRWAALGAFTPLMRTHHGSDECLNWTFDRDEETLAHYRRYATLHTLLYPMWQTLMEQARDEGLPIIRHPVLVEPGRPGLWRGTDYVFFVGDDVLVAPVLVEGDTTRTVQLPTPGWWPLFGNSPVVAGQENGADGTFDVAVAAGVTEIPAFVRPGTVIVALADSVDSLYGASDVGVTTLEAVEGRYRLALYPDADGRLNATSVGAALVDGEGWLSETTLETDPVWFDGVPIGACSEPVVAPCRGQGLLHVDVTGDHDITVGSAVLRVRHAEGLNLAIALSGAAWGEWGQPTTVTDLTPDVAPPCLDGP